MRKLNRLRLLVLLDLESSPTPLPSLLSTPVETMASPSKAHICRHYFTTIVCTIALFQVRSDVCAFGGDGGSRTHVQKSFALKGLQRYIIYYIFVCSPYVIYGILQSNYHVFQQTLSVHRHQSPLR